MSSGINVRQGEQEEGTREGGDEGGSGGQLEAGGVLFNRH